MSETTRRARWLKQLPWMLALVVVLGGAFGYWQYARTHQPPAAAFKTAPAEYRKITARVTASGTLQAVVTVQVGSQVSGRIQKLNVDFNSPVKKGELIAKIDPQLFQANVAQAHANFTSATAGVVQAQAKARDAERVYNRTKALHEQSLASQADLEGAETSLMVARSGIDVANAALEQAKAQLNQSEVNLSYTSIFSPIDGVVISRNVDVGQTVAASLQAPVLFTIAEDLRKMQVNTNIAEGDVGRLKPDMEAYFTVDAFPGQRFRGRISQIRNAPQTVQNVVTYDAVIDVDNSDLRLRPGMTANVTIVYDARDRALAVPNAALRYRPPPSVAASASAGGAPSGQHAGGRPHGPDAAHADGDTRTVWVQGGASAEARAVHVGLTDGTVTEITGGELKEGDAVITDTVGPGGGASAPGTARLGRMF